jgi:hypothetical protein
MKIFYEDLRGKLLEEFTPGEKGVDPRLDG